MMEIGRPVETGRPRKLFFQVLLTRVYIKILCQGKWALAGVCAIFSSIFPGFST